MADDYVIGVANSPLEVDGAAWDALLQTQSNPSPFMRHAYLAALHASGSAFSPHRLDTALHHPAPSWRTGRRLHGVRKSPLLRRICV